MKAIERANLTFKQVLAIFREAVVNSRSVVLMFETTLTQAHFLTLHPNTEIPDIDNNEEYRRKLMGTWGKDTSF